MVLYTIFFNHVWLYMAVSFHSLRNNLFLGVNQQPSVRNMKLPLMEFEPEPQRRGTSSFTARHLNHSVTEAPVFGRAITVPYITYSPYPISHTSRTLYHILPVSYITYFPARIEPGRNSDKRVANHYVHSTCNCTLLLHMTSCTTIFFPTGWVTEC